LFQQLPGKLNMSEYQKVTAALNTMQIDPGKLSKGVDVFFGHGIHVLLWGRFIEVDFINHFWKYFTDKKNNLRNSRLKL
jgi:hypothetical protein